MSVTRVGQSESGYWVKFEIGIVGHFFDIVGLSVIGHLLGVVALPVITFSKQ